MLYGLNRIAYLIDQGVSIKESYLFNCKNFEELLEQMYEGENFVTLFSKRKNKIEFIILFEINKLKVPNKFISYSND